MWSRDFAVGIFAVLPLWLLYEGLRLTLAPEERNGVEAVVTETVARFGSRAYLVLQCLFAITILVAAWSISRRRLPWAKVALVSALEGAVYGLVLGPVTLALSLFLLDSGRVLLQLVEAVPVASLGADIVASIGAGVFEEAMFRLGLLSLLALFFGRLARSMGVSVHLGIGIAIVASALAFAAAHHYHPASEPFSTDAFVFRTVAGLLLGVMFVFRGFAVCVYAHAVYDVHFYLTQSAPGT